MDAIKSSTFFGSKSKRSSKKKTISSTGILHRDAASPTTSSALPSSTQTTKQSPTKLNFDFKRTNVTASKKSRSFINQLSPSSRAKQFGQLDALAAASGETSISDHRISHPPKRTVAGRSLGTGNINNEDLIIKAVSSKLSEGSSDTAPRNPRPTILSSSSTKHSQLQQKLSNNGGYSTSTQKSMSRVDRIIQSLSKDGPTPPTTSSSSSSQATDIKPPTLDKASSSWDKGTSYNKYSSTSNTGSSFQSDAQYKSQKRQTNTPRSAIPYSRTTKAEEHDDGIDADDESYNMIDRVRNGIGLSKKYSSTGNNNYGKKASNHRRKEDESLSSEDSISDDDDDHDDDDSNVRGSASDGGDDDGSGSNEDYSNDEDEGEDGYKAGGYHPVKIAEVYNQR